MVSVHHREFISMWNQTPVCKSCSAILSCMPLALWYSSFLLLPFQRSSPSISPFSACYQEAQNSYFIMKNNILFVSFLSFLAESMGYFHKQMSLLHTSLNKQTSQKLKKTTWEKFSHFTKLEKQIHC